MAKYKKVKRYHRSFYSPGMWVKKAVGIIVLVAVVLVVGWLGRAPCAGLGHPHLVYRGAQP